MIPQSSQGKKTQGFQNKVKMVLGAIFCLLFVLFTVLSLPVYLFRIFVIILAKLLRPDLGSIMNGLNSYLVNDYFYHKKAPRSNIVVSLYLQGRDLSISELKKLLMERWLQAKLNKTGEPNFEQFQQYPVRWLGFTFYKNYEDTFDINDHVHLYDKPNNQNDFVNDEEISDICEKIMNSPFKPRTSPWEVHLVKNYKSDNMKTLDLNEKKFVLIFKFHHSLADGFSILTAIVEGFGQHDLSNVELPKPRLPKRNFWQKIVYYVSFPFKVMCEFSYSFSHIFRSTPWKVPNDKKEWYQNSTKSDSIPIHKVKFIKNQLGVSFTSVLLYSISSAIHKTLQNSKAKNPETSQLEGFFGDKSDLDSIYCASALPLPGHPGGLTNHTTIAVFDLPVGNNDDYMSGLRLVDKMLKTTKKSALPLCVPLYTTLAGCHLYPIGKHFANQQMFHIGLSNFPSLPIQIEQDNRKCFAVDFVAGALDGVAGMVVMVLSYGEYIRIGVTAEKAFLSKDEVKKFAHYIIEEIDHLDTEASMKYNRSGKDGLLNLNSNHKTECLHTSAIELV